MQSSLGSSATWWAGRYEISLIARQLQDRRGVEAKLRQLRHLVVKVESVVEAADARRITGRTLLAWLSELADGANRGRYFLDAFRGEAALELTGEDDDDGHGDGELRRPSFSPSSFNPTKRLRVAARRLLSRGGGAGELDGVLADLQSVSGGLAEFIVLLQSFPPAPYRPLATNVYADSQMFGRHLERRRVLDFLLHDDDGGELGVLPIIGRAGVGKTALVQHVCDEPAVRRRFSLIVLLEFHCMSFTAAGETAQLLRSLFTGAGEPLRLLERRLRGSFLGAKVVGALLRARPDLRLWRRLLAGNYTEPSCLGNGGYVAAAAGSLLPPHVTVRGVAVSGSLVRGVVGLQDAALTAPPHDGGGSPPELPVLLCKSDFPS